MITRKQAEHAQQILGARLARPQWLRGIGITFDDEGSHLLKVNVQEITDEVRSIIPFIIEGVPVNLCVVGTIVAQS